MTPDGKGGWAIETEPEWDEREIEWFTALDEYESGLCPACGNPPEWCHDPQRQRDVEGHVERCYVAEARARAMKKRREAGDIDYPEALLTRLSPKEA